MTTTITDGTDVVTVLRTNLVFDARGRARWSGGSTSGLTYESSGGPSGVPTWTKKALVAAGTGTYQTISQTSQPDYAPVLAGETYRVLVSEYHSHTPGIRVGPYITWYNASGGQLSQSVPSIAPGPVAQWNEVQASFTAPANAAFARLGLSAGPDTGWPSGAYVGTSRWIMLDSTGALVGLGWFDGESTADPPLSYAYLGPANASPSAEIETLPRTSTPDLVLSAVQGATARTLVHEVLDAEGGPDVTLRPAGFRVGEHRLFYLEREDAHDAYLMHRAARRFTMTDTENPFNDMVYVATGRLELEELVEYGRWVVTVGYQEVAA